EAILLDDLLKILHAKGALPQLLFHSQLMLNSVLLRKVTTKEATNKIPTNIFYISQENYPANHTATTDRILGYRLIENQWD
ncbi:MAG: hypothetical protein PUE35_01985, partial [Bacteroidales bacterium]|nr:hypothetical protein [Bacteroidales bacterium]